MDIKIMEYKCPCCNAGLRFSDTDQQLTCEYCDNTFDIGTVRAFQEDQSQSTTEQIDWDNAVPDAWAPEERNALRAYQCPSCGGEILAEETTAATFCPYCGNPSIIPAKLSGEVKPDGILPFKTSKEDAVAAFLSLCKGKPLLPRFFTSRQQVEKITGMYVPFWLYDCSADYRGGYRATRIHTWSDQRYDYTKTDHFLLRRHALASFTGIPMDGSRKMDDTFMESIEPFDYSQIVDFDMAYLSGFLADQYDVPSEQGEERIRQRTDHSMEAELQASFLGYHSVIPTHRNLHVSHSKARYVLLPVWVLNTRYNDKVYTFMMNGQTGKMTGTLPACRKRTISWFAGICACVTLISYGVQLLLK